MDVGLSPDKLRKLMFGSPSPDKKLRKVKSLKTKVKDLLLCHSTNLYSLILIFE